MTAGGPYTKDRALALEAAEGGERALREVLGRVAGKMRSIGWHMTYDSYEAEDLCQEALLKMTAPPVLRSYRGEGPLDGYLVNVGVRAMLSVRRTRRSSEWRDAVVTDSLPEPAADGGDPAAGALDPTLRAALERLPERARLIVLLITVGDYTYDEAADATGLAVGTVKSAYSRARATLRSALAGHPASAGAEA